MTRPTASTGRTWPLLAGDEPDEQALADQIRSRVAAALARHASDREDSGEQAPFPAETRALVAGLIGEALEDGAAAALRAGHRPPDAEAEARVTRLVTASLLGLGGLQVLLDDPQIENIDVNGCDHVFVRYADGRTARMDPVAASDAEL